MPSPDQKLFATVSSLPQGMSILQHATELAKKRLASQTCLEELEQVSTCVVEEEGKAPTDRDVATLISLWERALLADKAEAQNISALELKMKCLAQAAVSVHSESELADFINSQTVHIQNNMKTLVKPIWKVDGLKKFIPNEAIFRSD